MMTRSIILSLLPGYDASGNFGHAVDRRDRQRVDVVLQGDTKGVADRGPALLHGD